MVVLMVYNCSMVIESDCETDRDGDGDISGDDSENEDGGEQAMISNHGDGGAHWLYIIVCN